MTKHKIVVAVTGASGAIYAQLLLAKLEMLSPQLDTCSLVFSDCGKQVWAYELGNDEYTKSPFTLYKNDDLFAPFASGSSGYNTLIVCPCTMGTLGRIASGIAGDLITRTADVMLKERKKLILVTREMPLNLIHINNMKSVTEAGGIICPASPSFYSKPEKTNALLNTVIDKVLSLAGFEINAYKWGQ